MSQSFTKGEPGSVSVKLKGFWSSLSLGGNIVRKIERVNIHKEEQIFILEFLIVLKANYLSCSQTITHVCIFGLSLLDVELVPL